MSRVLFWKTIREELQICKVSEIRPRGILRDFGSKDFLRSFRGKIPSIIDAAFLGQIAPSNEGKLLAQLKFLSVIDEQGKPTRLLPLLNMVGEEQKKAFREIANSATWICKLKSRWTKQFRTILVNFFIRKYGFTRDKAVNAARFYLYLAEKGGVAVSEELGSFLTERAPNPAQSNGMAPVTPRIFEKSITRSQGRETKSHNTAVLSRQNRNRKLRTADLEERLLSKRS